MDQRTGAACGPQGRAGSSPAARQATDCPGIVIAPEIAPPGASAPLGATVSDGGVNFSVFAKDATRVELLLFGNAEATEPSHTIALDPQAHRTYHYWHALVPGIGPGQIYGYRAIGPFAPDRGLRFDGEKLLLDPYGRAVAVPRAYDRMAARQPGSNVATAMKSVVSDRNGYDWEDDRPLGRPFAETIIYELHVRGFTRHPSSGVVAGRARHLRRADREDSLPDGPRDHRRRAPAGLPVRSAGRAGGPLELLGLPARLVLRAASRVQLTSWRAADPRRVSRHGQGAAPRRHRSHPRRRVQPHDRRRRGRPDDLLSRLRKQHLLHPAGRQVGLRRLHGLRQHAQCQSADRAPIDPGQPALLGHRDARGWIPVRSRLNPLARRVRPSRARPAGPLGHRVGSAPRRHQAHRRSLGRRRPVSGRRVRRRRVAGMERPLPRRRSPFPEGRRRVRPACRSPSARQPRHLRPERARARAQHQLRDVPRRVHAERSRLVQREAQRGQRRAEPRRSRRQQKLELRRRGPDVDGGHRDSCATAR